MSRFFLVGLLGLLGCAHQPEAEAAAAVDTSAVRAAIEQCENQYAKALVRGDAVAIASVFADDGQFTLSSRKGTIQGRAAIQAFNEERLKTTKFLEATITTTDVRACGDWAYETGTNRLTRQQGDTAPVTTTGRYLTIWARESDGQWRIKVDMVATDPSP